MHYLINIIEWHGDGESTDLGAAWYYGRDAKEAINKAIADADWVYDDATADVRVIAVSKNGKFSYV